MLLVAAWTRDSLELWRLDAQSGATPERQRVDVPFADEGDRNCLRLRMTRADRGWLRTRMDGRGVVARVFDGGRRVVPCAPVPGSARIDLNTCKIHGRDVVTVIEGHPALAPSPQAPFGSRIHRFEGGQWESTDTRPSMVVHDVSFAPNGGIWLAAAERPDPAVPRSLWFQSSPAAEPEPVPVRLDLESRVRLATGRMLGAQIFEEFRRIDAESEPLVAFGDSPDLWDFPVSYVVARRRDGLFSAHRFGFGVGFASTRSCGIVVTPEGEVSSIDGSGRLRRRASRSKLSSILTACFPEVPPTAIICRTDALDDGRLAIRVDLGDERGTSAQAICVSHSYGAQWEIIVATRPTRGEPTLADVSWVR